MTDGQVKAVGDASSPRRSAIARLVRGINRARGPIAAIAAVGAILSGLVGYWTTYRVVRQSVIVTPAAPADRPQEALSGNAGPLSLVVLPFANLTGNPAQAFLADGLTASVTSDLSRIRDAFIIGIPTARAYRDKLLTAKQIGAELGVHFVLQGNVQASGTKIRVDAQLTDCATNAQLWSETFDGNTSDLFALQDKITLMIGNSLGRELVIRAAFASERSPSTPKVGDLVLQARALLLQPDSWDNYVRLESLWRRVLAIEPMNAEALLGLGRSLQLQVYNYPENQNRATREQKTAELTTLAKRAESIDPNDPVLFALQASIAFAAGDYDGAKRKSLLVLEQAPNWPRAYNIVGYVFVQTVQPEKACETLKRGVALDPKHPGILVNNLQICEFMLGDDGAALDWGLRAKDVSLEDQAILAATYARSGHVAEARGVYSGATELPKLSALVKDVDTDPGSWPPYKSWFKKTVIPALRLAGFPE